LNGLKSVQLLPMLSCMSIDAGSLRLMGRAKRAAPLSAAAELDCIRAWQEGRDRKAAGRVIEANSKHVVFTALRFKNYGIAVGDLISDGHLGLMKALDRFDPGKSVRFSTYAAYWIRAQIIAGVLDGWCLLSGPRGALNSRLFFRLRRRRSELASCERGPIDSPSVLERLAAEFGVTEQRMQELLQQLDHRGMSLDDVAPGEDSSLLEQLAGADDPAMQLEHCQLLQQAERALERGRARLDSREVYIIERRLLAEPEEQRSLGELGDELGVSRERVRQLELRALDKLRREAACEAVAPANGRPVSESRAA
jgi:RNA polymerase sigma-32 factor